MSEMHDNAWRMALEGLRDAELSYYQAVYNDECAGIRQTPPYSDEEVGEDGLSERQRTRIRIADARLAMQKAQAEFHYQDYLDVHETRRNVRHWVASGGE